MMPYTTYHPSSDAATPNQRLEGLGIPRDPLGAHQWIVAGVAPDILYRLAELMKTDVGMVCQWAGISRSTLARKLRITAPYQYRRVPGYTELHRLSMWFSPFTGTIPSRHCLG